MPGQHYVSKFHLSEFTSPDSTKNDSFLWVGAIREGTIKRERPKNLGTAEDLFDGPGGLREPNASIEKFLANEIEGPAARAFRKLERSPEIQYLPPEIMRYLAWAASRSIVMQRLELEWGAGLGDFRSLPTVEPPPPGLDESPERSRPVLLINPLQGTRVLAQPAETDSLVASGWIPDPMERTNFLELSHLQTYYFQTRWFPRLRWFILRPPAGQFFIIGDRPVGWGLPGSLSAPPSCLRDSSCFLIAPITRTLALVGRNRSEPWSITSDQVNAVLAAWCHTWIAGPTVEVVQTALFNRKAIGNIEPLGWRRLRL